jgi:hypothetical protein
MSASWAQWQRWVDGITGSGRMMTLWARGWHRVDDVTGLGMERDWWHCRLGNNTYGLDGVTGSGLGNMVVCTEGSTGVGDDGLGAPGNFLVGIFGWWHEYHLRGLWFPKAAQLFIYRGTTLATGVGDFTSPVAIEDHSGNGRMKSSAPGYRHQYIYSAIMK